VVSHFQAVSSPTQIGSPIGISSSTLGPEPLRLGDRRHFGTSRQVAGQPAPVRVVPVRRLTLSRKSLDRDAPSGFARRDQLEIVGVTVLRDRPVVQDEALADGTSETSLSRSTSCAIWRIRSRCSSNSLPGSPAVEITIICAFRFFNLPRQVR
jgi:hypothetical protein